MISVDAGLRRGDLLNAAPSTLDLMNDGHIGFDAKTEVRGSLKDDIGELECFLTLQLVIPG